ncbi:MAG TPA: hypothetical protein DCZ10_12135 [Pelotomaculum sp.]|nr:hypothetical protein [Pelotomaculum sp.]
MLRQNRLTDWDNNNPYIRECFERTVEQGGCEHMDTTRCTWCEHNLATLRRLAEYDDSGLSPDQIKMLLEKLKEAVAGDKNNDFTLEEIVNYVREGLLAALDKLAEYESTGLSPE